MIRRLARPLVGVAALILLAAAVVLISKADADGGPASTGTSAPARTAKVAKRDLAETQDVSGTVGYGESRELGFGGPGTITALTPTGSVVDRGGQLGEIDGRRVTLMIGERPMWRDLAPGVPDGADVAQLEANLIALGHGSRASLGSDGAWTQNTTAAVERWQRSTGQPETGAVATRDAVFAPAPVRIAQHVTPIGGRAGGPALKVTGTARQVTIDLDAAYQTLVKVGQEVGVTLPGDVKTAATITSVGTVAAASQPGQEPTVPVTATLKDQSVATNLDQAPVTVHFVTSQADDVLAAPVGALLALAEGGYAVEKVTGPGTTELIGVTPGAFADGWVQITPAGAVGEGDQVVVAE